MDEKNNENTHAVEVTPSSEGSAEQVAPEPTAPAKEHTYPWWMLVVVGLVILGGLFYFFFSGEKEPAAEPASIVVRLGWLHQGQFAGFYTALEKGFYDDVRLDVELRELDRSVNQVEELSQGEADFSVMEAHQLLAGVDSGVNISAVMAVYQINPHVLAARADSGIQGPQDFSGKTIGLAGGEGEGNALFRVFAERFGDADSLTYKNLGFDTVDSFINKEADVIDLYQIDQPYLAEQKGVPLTVISLDAYGFSTYGDVVVASNRLLDEQPDVVERFVNATIKGWEYAMSNTEEAVEITLPYTSGDYADIDYQRHIIEKSVPLVRGTTADLGRMEFVSWSTLYETMRSADAFTTEFDVKDVYTNAFIK